MKKMYVVFALLMTAAPGILQAQNTASISTTGHCPQDVLTVFANFPKAQIEWKYNGNTIKTVTASPQANAITVGGGNGFGSGADQMREPNGISVDTSGAVYVSDFHYYDVLGGRVRKYTPGSVSGPIVAGGNGTGSNPDQFTKANGIFVDAAGNMYVPDYDEHRVQKWAPGATTGVTVAGGNGQGNAADQLDGPNDVWVDAAGNVYVADRNNDRVQKWAPGATSGTTVAVANWQYVSFWKMDDVCVTQGGDIYLSCNSNSSVKKWVPATSSWVDVAGGNGYGSAANQLSYGTRMGIWLDANDNLYIADGGNHRIQKWAAGATTGVTVAGGNGQGGSANQLNRPQDVCTDKSGNIYVLDAMNYRAQKFRPIDDTLRVSLPGVYTAVVTDFSSGTVTTNHIAISSFPPALATASGPTVLCAGGTASSVTLNANTGAGLSWQWQRNGQNLTGATAPSHTVNSIYGTYTVVVSNGVCATVSNPVNVTPLPPATVMASGPLQFCEGNSVTLQADTTPGVTYQWKRNGVLLSGATASSYTADSSGIYTAELTYTGTNGSCATPSNPTTVKVKPVPQLNLTVSSSCPPATLDLVSDIPLESIRWQYNGNVIDTVEATWRGNGVTVAGGNGSGNATNQLDQPFNIFVDDNGNLYVVDNGNGRVQLWAPGATSGITVAGGNGTGNAPNQLNNPLDVYVDAQNNVFVADNGNGRVQQWAPGATSGTTVISGSGNPNGVWVDGSGNKYVSFANRIEKWATGAASGITVAGGNGYGSMLNQFAEARGFSLDDSNSIYVADQQNSRVVKWKTGAAEATLVGQFPNGTWFHLLYDAFVKSSGNVFTTETGNNRIVRWAPGSGTPVIEAGDGISNISNISLPGQGGSAADQFSWAMASFIDKNGALYVADRFNHRVQKFSPKIVDTLVANSMGNYTAIVVAQNGCTAVSDTVNPAPAAAIVQSGSLGLCQGDTVQLKAHTQPGYIYQWYKNGTEITGATDTVYTATSAGSYTIMATYDTCSASSAAVTVVIHALPQPQITLNGAVLNTGSYDAYQWNLNGTPIGGATDSFFTPTQNGSYTVTVTDSNGCKGTSTSQPITIGVASGPGLNDRISIYPNPASTMLHVAAPYPVSVAIYSMEGKEVIRRQETAALDVGTLADGVYTVRISNRNGVVVAITRLVKNSR